MTLTIKRQGDIPYQTNGYDSFIPKAWKQRNPVCLLSIKL
jgi:hypothetical protein